MDFQPPPAVAPGSDGLELEQIALQDMAGEPESDAVYADTPPGSFGQGAMAATPRLRPELVHSGTYALWRTPAGLFHLTHRRTASTDPDSGQIVAVDDSPEVHCRDLPEHAAMMVWAVLDRDQELPPMLASFLLGNPLQGGRAAIMRQVAGLVKESGGVDQLLEFAQQQNGGQPDGPVE